jgi:osmoprotectant transport system ATP-binding protein
VTDPGTSSDIAVELKSVSYRLPEGRTLIENLDLRVRRGEMLTMLGRSGAGKTTALKLINGLLEPSSGEVIVEGRPQKEWDPICLRRTIGYVIQEVGLFPHWSVERNVALVPRLENWPESRVQERVREMMNLVGLAPAEFAGRFPRELSGGQRQRVGVARALAADPPILLMDEPFGALDPVTAAELDAEFHSLAARLGKTILFVTHNLQSALLNDTRIALIAQGRMTGIYTTAEFVHSPDLEVRAFLASIGVRNGKSPTTQGKEAI